MTCDCGGKILTVYIRQGKPLRWVPLGKACIQCRKWEGETGHHVDTNPRDPFLVDPLQQTTGESEHSDNPPLDTPPGEASGVTITGPGVPGLPVAFVPEEGLRDKVRGEWKPVCTCGPGEKAKGKHNKKCPAR